MISGDNAKTVQAVGAMAGIPADHIIAGVLPEQKADKIKYLQKSQVRPVSRLGIRTSSYRRPIVAMAGDGINDTRALAVADIGIDLGSGSDVAVSAAEFVLLNSKLLTLLTLLTVSRAVCRRAKLNFVWALVYHVAALPIAAGVLYHIKTGGNYTRLDPVWAALAMVLSSMSVIASSLLLRSRLPLHVLLPTHVDSCHMNFWPAPRRTGPSDRQACYGGPPRSPRSRATARLKRHCAESTGVRRRRTSRPIFTIEEASQRSI
ncbi:putative copper-importing P-type ATPase A [Colletotrichum orbiculare MAFF 240422]|uniref:Copper-importing P-type ATPase A n=1 Tax=Colletotrichum orbiculare (strain 104-T / ATCC 96160 / CBS 514.97 / LARS 414 / MAFF 240422) TaxID=1213857 RepID=A0A484G3U5_COLOR|nr:putative copper-importing P-type ATPase A [Colletotrichum orbiculare MAFF 240422]